MDSGAEEEEEEEAKGRKKRRGLAELDWICAHKKLRNG